MRNSPLLLAILAALPACETTVEGTGCMGVPAEQTMCPSDPDPSKLSYSECGDYEVTDVKGAGKFFAQYGQTGEPACCYPVEAIDHDPSGHCEFGRPYLDGGRSLLAPIAARSDAALSAKAAAWLEAGAAEHASIAAFSRLALQLLALGAPTELVAGVLSAAQDEIRHAERCFELAETLGASGVKPGAFPFGGSVDTDITLAELAAAAVREGCLTETLCAHVTQVAAALTQVVEVGPLLSTIADEESTHAVLSFRIVAWALRVGGDDVRSAVREAFSAPWPRPDFAELALRTNLDPGVLERVAVEGVEQVLQPAAVRLLAA